MNINQTYHIKVVGEPWRVLLFHKISYDCKYQLYNRLRQDVNVFSNVTFKIGTNAETLIKTYLPQV